MLQVSVKITGLPEQITRLEHFKDSLNDFSGAMKYIGEELKSYYGGQVFASQGAVLGVRWPTLAAKTVQYKLKNWPHYATTPLIRTGEMKQSFVAKSNATSVTITNTAPYFKYHQSLEPRRRIPYRPMIGINNDVKNIVHDIISADITKKIEALS